MIFFDNFIQKTNKSFLRFLFVFLIIAFADAIISYTTPVFLNSKISNANLLGLILASSSVVGFTFDIFAGAYLKQKSYKFFLVSTCLIAILFPISLLFSANLLVMYLIAMIFWGIYFELRAFSMFNYVKYSIPKSSYDYALTFFEITFAIAYLIGPIVATNLIKSNINFAIVFSLVLFIFAFFVSNIWFKNKRNIHKEIEQTINKNSLKTEFRVWKVLSGKIWIVWIMWFFIWCFDASIWTAGVLLSEKLKHINIAAEFLISIYIFPKLFLGVIISKFDHKLDKKKIAFISSINAGIFFIFMGLASSVSTILFLMFFGSLLLTISIVLLSSTFEDYIQRLGKHGAELIGLEQSAASLGYIVSPIITFMIIQKYNEQIPFTFWGIILVIWGIFSVIYVPRNIKMPQNKIKVLDLDL